jgi:hypothetical protein
MCFLNQKHKVMCSSDISPQVWELPEAHGSKPQFLEDLSCLDDTTVLKTIKGHGQRRPKTSFSAPECPGMVLHRRRKYRFIATITCVCPILNISLNYLFTTTLFHTNLACPYKRILDASFIFMLKTFISSAWDALLGQLTPKLSHYSFSPCIQMAWA